MIITLLYRLFRPWAFYICFNLSCKKKEKTQTTNHLIYLTSAGMCKQEANEHAAGFTTNTVQLKPAPSLRTNKDARDGARIPVDDSEYTVFAGI